MNLDTAVGINTLKDAQTGQELTHEERMDRYIQFLGGVAALKPYLPFPVEMLREKLQQDPWLNNTSMAAWDRAAGFVSHGADCTPTGGGLWYLYRQHGIDTASCSIGVCILKEVARKLIAATSETENTP